MHPVHCGNGNELAQYQFTSHLPLSEFTIVGHACCKWPMRLDHKYCSNHQHAKLQPIFDVNSSADWFYQLAYLIRPELLFQGQP